MKKPELYHKTVSILYDAYFNDTLKHGDCTACAVGNICLANGAPKTNLTNENDYYNNASWKNLFFTSSDEHVQITRPINYTGNIQVVIEQTGYSWQDLAKIEHAFEIAPEGNSKEDWMFNGLVAVLDVLAEIHEVDNDSEVKEKFKQHHLTRV